MRPKEGLTRISHSPIPNQKQDNYKGESPHTSLCGLFGAAKIMEAVGEFKNQKGQQQEMSYNLTESQKENRKTPALSGPKKKEFGKYSLISLQ